jgi:hypothetical protein
MDIHYEASSAVAATIVNICLNSSESKVELFSKILRLVYFSMKEAQAEMDGIRFLPSDN